MDCMITYQKPNGEIIFRPRKSVYDRKVGDTTSMGWKVIDIHYRYNGNYYTYLDFMKLIRRKESLKKRCLRKLAQKINKLAK